MIHIECYFSRNFAGKVLTYRNLMSNVECRFVSGTILKNGFSTPSYFHVYFILLQSYLSLTLCDRSYPLLNTEMDTFLKYYFSTFIKNLFALASILYAVNSIIHYSFVLYFGKQDVNQFWCGGATRRRDGSHARHSDNVDV